MSSPMTTVIFPFYTGRLEGSFWSSGHSEKCLPSPPWWEVTGGFLDLLALFEPVSSEITPPILHRSTGTSTTEFQFPWWEDGKAVAGDPCSWPWGFTMDGGGGGGTDMGCSWIRDDFSGAFNFGRPACIATENLPDKWASRRGKTALTG